MRTFSILKPVPAVLTTALLAFLIQGCSTVPETGRRQLNLIPDSQMTSLSLSEFDKIKKSTPPSRDAALCAMVERVGRRIASVAPLPNAQWEFVLFDDPKTANAFCLPGGKVAVYTGLLPVTQNEGGLATVVGHEVAHAVAKHGNERMSEALMIQYGGKALEELLKSKPEETRAIWSKAYNVTGQVGVQLPHSRKQELEADNMGLTYMARAGYDPNEAVAFWKRFSAFNEQAGHKPQFAFLSTHPVDSTRIAELEKLLPKALEEYRKAAAKR